MAYSDLPQNEWLDGLYEALQIAICACKPPELAWLAAGVEDTSIPLVLLNVLLHLPPNR